MFNRLTPMLAAAAVMVAGAAVHAGEELKIGDEAPDLKHVNWVKGDPVKEFQTGQVYVLDFWATWCGPCIAAIPHMNEVAQKHQKDGVNVIAVAVFPRQNMTPVKEFVQGRGDGMSYRVADDIDAKTAKAYMDGTLSSGIPTVMIINRAGKLAWIGHPMGGMDEALANIINNKHDLAAAAKADAERREAARARMEERRIMQELSKKLKPYQNMLEDAAVENDWATVLSVMDKMIAIDPVHLASYHGQKYQIAITQMQDKAAAREIAADILASPTLMKDAMFLNGLSWSIVDPHGGLPDEMRDLGFAHKLAEKADELTKGENASIIDTLARVHFVKGDVSTAIGLQEKAVEKASGPMKEQLQQVLDEYKAARSS